MTRSLSVMVSVLGLAAFTVAACTVNTTAVPTTPPVDSDAGADAAVEAAVQPMLGFQPSNIDLKGIDLTNVGDQDVTGECAVTTGTQAEQCFDDAHIARVDLTQSNGSNVEVIVVKSLRIEPSGHLLVRGGLPLVIVSLGDITILGSIEAHAESSTGYAGGLTQRMPSSVGSGPGGGTAGTGGGAAGLSAGGGSYCGLGGKGAAETGAAGTPAASPAAYGATDLRPLVGGSSGGSGSDPNAGAGGGAVQLVANGTFTLSAGAYINVGGGGGGKAPSLHQNACGGGSGGAVLIEATTVSVSGVIAANGGAGGGGGDTLGVGATDGLDGTPDTHAAAGGLGDAPGGVGSAGASTVGGAGGDVSGSPASGGAGAAGRIRINSMSAMTTVSTTSPDSTTPCVTQGKLRAIGTGI
jgi:hypothetical protein